VARVSRGRLHRRGPRRGAGVVGVLEVGADSHLGRWRSAIVLVTLSYSREG